MLSRSIQVQTSPSLQRPAQHAQQEEQPPPQQGEPSKPAGPRRRARKVQTDWVAVSSWVQPAQPLQPRPLADRVSALPRNLTKKRTYGRRGKRVAHPIATHGISRWWSLTGLTRWCDQQRHRRSRTPRPTSAPPASPAPVPAPPAAHQKCFADQPPGLVPLVSLVSLVSLVPLVPLVPSDEPVAGGRALTGPDPGGGWWRCPQGGSDGGRGSSEAASAGSPRPARPQPPLQAVSSGPAFVDCRGSAGSAIWSSGRWTHYGPATLPGKKGVSAGTAVREAYFILWRAS